MLWEPLAEWGRRDSDFDELSPSSTSGLIKAKWGQYTPNMLQVY